MPTRMTHVLLTLEGYDFEQGVLLIGVSTAVQVAGMQASGARYANDPMLQRAFVDMQAWDRALARTRESRVPRLSTRRWRRLMELTWTRDDESKGWRIELQKNVSACEKWLNLAFKALPFDQQRAFVDEDRYGAYQEQRTAVRFAKQHARDMQQYFTSAPLIEFVLSSVTDWLLQLKTTVSSERVAWLEPSCGDGRILSALLKAGARYVHGFELDEALCRRARDKVQPPEGAVCSIQQGDFLASRRSHHNQDLLFALGNPPFGSKHDEGRRDDLVLSFYRHTAVEWKASVIAFIVPERCASPSFVAAALEALSDDTSQTSTKWRLALTQSLEGFIFEFMAIHEFRQPSVLQLFTTL